MEKKDRNHNSYSELPKGGSPSKTSWLKKELSKGKENKEIKILKKMKSIKEKNSTPEKSSPEKFSGEGVNFRAKIIGIEQVIDARGNRMCQGALQRLKVAVKTSGDHKQRIILNISLAGIIIKDEKTGEELHHHPIHKISFISQDTKDSRAFGYVHGCPQTGHEFFAIKTEKAASQVVVTLRDLFLVALELKKAELERTQNLEQTEIQSNGNDDFEKENLNESSGTIRFSHGEDAHSGLGSSVVYSNIVMLPEETELKHPDSAEPVMNEQANLQSELDILQESIFHMDHSIAVSESFRSSVEGELSSAFQGKLNKLYQETLSVSSRSSTASDYTIAPPDVPPSAPLETSASLSTCSSSSVAEEENHHEDRYAVFLNIDSMPSIFDNPSITYAPKKDTVMDDALEPAEQKVSDSFDNPEEMLSQNKDLSATERENDELKPLSVAFAELDPLGNQPYVDKRDFFQDLKQPPKKVLKDLVGSEAFNEINASQENVAFANFDSESAFSSEEVPEDNPPKLPPKRSVGAELRPDVTASGTKNPFNPFLNEEAFEIPPPSISPPPPPPRSVAGASECPAFASPPPRPPSRVGAVLTPPLPKRKIPLSHAWLSFDQDASFSAEAAGPPLPSPARKVSKPEALESVGASTSPSFARRVLNQSPHFLPNEISSRKGAPYNSSPKAFLASHTSIAEATFNPFCEKLPPIPPKPASVFTPKQQVADSSSSSMSVIESSSGTRSSSSLVFSSVDENSGGTSSEALFSNSNFSEVFSDSSKESYPSKKPPLGDQLKDDMSPDSIFRRKGDPFADDFFLSLHSKSYDCSTENSSNLENFNDTKVSYLTLDVLWSAIEGGYSKNTVIDE